jgi:nitroreductase
MDIIEDIIQARTPKTNLPVISNIKKRFSPRVFSGEEINQADVKTMFEAARLAPSGRNIQPWFFYYAKKNTSEYEKLLGCIPERNQWVNSAPIIVIACYIPNEKLDVANKWALYDLGAAVMSLVLQATELGYCCRQIGSFDSDKTKIDLAIPNPLLPYTIVAIGKIGSEKDYQNASPEVVAKDLAPNPRKEKIFQELPV